MIQDETFIWEQVTLDEWVLLLHDSHLHWSRCIWHLQVQRIGPGFFFLPSLGSKATEIFFFASESNKILNDIDIWKLVHISNITNHLKKQSAVTLKSQIVSWHFDWLSHFDIMHKVDEHLRSAVSKSHSLSTCLRMNLPICSLLTVLTKIWLTSNNKANC